MKRKFVRPRGRYCYKCGERLYLVQDAAGEQFLVTSYKGGGNRWCPR